MKSSWILPLLCLACGSDEGSGRSGIPAATKLSELKVDQARVLCRALVRYDYDHYSVQDGCTVDAVYETSSLAECVQYVDVCTKDEKAELSADRKEDLEDCDSLDAGDLDLGCETTVAVFEDCYREAVDAYASAARKLSCTDAGDEDFLGEEFESYASDECEAVLDECAVYRLLE